MTFGIPIMYNPIMSIPFVLNIPVVMLCALVLYKIGFLTPGWIVITRDFTHGFWKLSQYAQLAQRID